MSGNGEKVGMVWRSIETAPKPHEWLRRPPGEMFVLAKFSTPVDEEGEAIDPELVWSHVAYLTANGFMLPTRGMAGTHGYASFLLSPATHWMPLPITLDAALQREEG